MSMTPEAKKALSATIRGLRARLLEDLHAATETAYRLSVRARDAGLDEAARVRRARLESWIAEQQRADAATGKKGASPRPDDAYRRDVEKRAASTLLNRLVVLRLMEASRLRAPVVVTGGWESRGYKDFRSLAPALVRDDSTEGYAFLLRLVFEDLAIELPGIFGSAGVADLVPVPPATLRHVVEALDAPELQSCWTDDMTLGWVYQYWNDPAREALDAKLNAGGKVEPHEIASKTQMFTERYMVDWLLQNSLGPMWLAMCRKHGWTAEVQADGILDRLEERRVDWRAKREAGEVELTDLMPLQTDAERRWAYYVPQPIPEDAVAKAPGSVRDLKVLDPAVGSGHFLVVAFDLLVALYREEARHRGQAGAAEWSDRAIVERILSHNLHGIDLDPRAVQIAAAALWLKAKQAAPDARPARLNLVASGLRLASLPDDDPALVELRREVERETGIPGALTDTLVHALRGADHLGSLLQVDSAVDAALARHEAELGRVKSEQGGLFGGFAERRERVAIGHDEAKATLLERLEGFLAKHTGGEDLGLRLRGEQLAAGVRFVRLVKEGTYDLVVANPPYQGTSKMADAKYVQTTYKLGKADLYTAFLLRGLDLVRDGGVSAMLTMRNWMFIKQYAGLREHLLGKYDLRALGDFAVGAFDEVPNDVLSVTVSVLHRAGHRPEDSVAQQPTPPDDTSYDRARTQRKRAATRCHEGRHTFDPAALKVVPEWPLVYWWPDETLGRFANYPLLGRGWAVRAGLNTSSNIRYIRRAWEVPPAAVLVEIQRGSNEVNSARWYPAIMGGAGEAWMSALLHVVLWDHRGLQMKVMHEKRWGSYTKRVQNEEHYFRPGIAFPKIGSAFLARAHTYVGIFNDAAPSVFATPSEIPGLLCAMNSTRSREILRSLNPTTNFQVGDVERLPVEPPEGADPVIARLRTAFLQHELAREGSPEFTHPGPSPWRHAQDWAQLAVDRPGGAPLPGYVQQFDPEPPTDHLSFALGVALGRFGPDRAGILDPAAADLSHALPAGILFLDRTLDDAAPRDGLGHPAAAPRPTAWASHGPAIDTRRGLRDWLALDFFKDVHRTMYENRPIHWPLSSSSRTFVAWITIHRMTEQTLRILLADHLHPTLARIDGELADLRAARDSGDARASRAAEKQVARTIKARDELLAFINDVEDCADHGPPPPDAKTPPRARDAAYAPNLDDGVMINSAALWPLLTPQWKDPKKWWKELATAKGRKDYDWSRLAMRYWPDRVDAKCKDDPSLGVAHGCFWRYNPERAWAWELRLQDEIGPDFRIEEAPYCQPDSTSSPDHVALRAAFLRDYPDQAIAAVEKEALRRMGRGKSKTVVSEMRLLETGLWTDHAAAMWDRELRLSTKQDAELRILAPDEPAARAAFEAANPSKVRSRRALLAEFEPQTGLFDAKGADA